MAFRFLFRGVWWCVAALVAVNAPGAMGAGMKQAMAYLYPYLKDKSAWPLKPDVQAWEGWPARQPCLFFAGLAEGNTDYLDLWKTLKPDPQDLEVRPNIAITQPVLWLGR